MRTRRAVAAAAAADPNRRRRSRHAMRQSKAEPSGRSTRRSRSALSPNGEETPAVRRAQQHGTAERLCMMAALMSLNDDELATEPGRAPDHRKLASVVRIVDAAGNDVCVHCEVAESAIARMRGLLGRDGLEPGHGM